jgi:glycosyltransferase involved in cell wall biosynthesis
MSLFYRTQNGIARTELVIHRLVSGIIVDFRELCIQGISNLLRNSSKLHANLKRSATKFGFVNNVENTVKLESQITQSNKVIQQFATPLGKPVIFASYCIDQNFKGDLKFCGGTKELNLLIKLLRQKDFEAYMVTYDGSYEPWLNEHQPHLSISDFQAKLRSNDNVRCITSLACASAFIRSCPQIYFWDMELAFTDHQDFRALANLYKTKLNSVATISRTIQAWHMAHFQRSCVLLPNLVDQLQWFPQPEHRHLNRVGYMNEGEHTEKYISSIQKIINKRGLELEFYLIQGPEADILAGLRSCEVFLTMNIGKDLLWGEGGPLPPLEAMATGCVPIAFDIIGPREFIHNGFNGVIVPRYRPDLMAEALIGLYTRSGERERLRTNSLAMMQSCHTFEARWPAVQEFLHL